MFPLIQLELLRVSAALLYACCHEINLFIDGEICLYILIFSIPRSVLRPKICNGFGSCSLPCVHICMWMMWWCVLVVQLFLIMNTSKILITGKKCGWICEWRWAWGSFSGQMPCSGEHLIFSQKMQHQPGVKLQLPAPLQHHPWTPRMLFSSLWPAVPFW